MELIKKSFFKKIIETVDIRFCIISDYSDCRTSPFIPVGTMGTKEKLSPQRNKTSTSMKTVDLFKIDIPSPLLSIGDEFYSEKLDKIFTIQKAMRTDNDNICYIVNEPFEQIINEKSLMQYKIDKKEFFKNTQCYKKYMDLLGRINEINVELKKKHGFFKWYKAYQFLKCIWNVK